jgi:hypothetical protein
MSDPHRRRSDDRRVGLVPGLGFVVKGRGQTGLFHANGVAMINRDLPLAGRDGVGELRPVVGIGDVDVLLRIPVILVARLAGPAWRMERAPSPNFG